MKKKRAPPAAPEPPPVGSDLPLDQYDYGAIARGLRAYWRETLLHCSTNAGVHVSTWWRWEHGTRPCTLNARWLLDLCRRSGATIYLLSHSVGQDQ